MAVFFTYVLPLLLPTAIYMLWRMWRLRTDQAAAAATAGSLEGPADSAGATDLSDDILWRDAPWFSLAGAGIVLLVAMLLIGIFLRGSAPSARYVPPHLENGRIVPGELRSDESGAGRLMPQEPRETR